MSEQLRNETIRGGIYSHSPYGLARICSVRQVTEMYSVYKRQRILHYERIGYKAPTICRLLREGGMRVSRVGVPKFCKVQGKEEHTAKTRLGPTDEYDGSSEGARREADEG